MPRIESSSIQSALSRLNAQTTQANGTNAATTPQQVVKTTSTDQVKLSNLTEEEKKFVEMKLLPANYADIKACLKEKGLDAAKQLARQGKKGPFTSSYGDPNEMLKGAKRIAGNPELLRMSQNIKKGDILVENWNCNTEISQLTKGPYIHTVVCTSDGPPPDFIEAFGLMGTSAEEGDNCVRRIPMSATMYDGLSVRIVRPAENLPEPQRSKTIDKAVQYVEKQLGQPYDYAMTNDNSQSNAFYCSELAYKAYAEGAKMKFPLSKSVDRDQMVVAINDIVNALDPNSKADFVTDIWQFMSKSPAPTSDDFVDLLVDEIFPSCETTAEISTSDTDRSHLKSTIKTVLEGDAFPDFDKAVKSYEEKEKSGAFKGFFGTIKQGKAHLDTLKAFAEDCVSLVKNSGADISETLMATKDLVEAILPHAETLSTFFFGSDDSKTQSVSNLLDKLDWVKSKKIPFISNNIPGRAKDKVQSDFVSPTDLAMSPLPHYDYNVKEG